MLRAGKKFCVIDSDWVLLDTTKTLSHAIYYHYSNISIYYTVSFFRYRVALVYLSVFQYNIALKYMYGMG